MRNVDFPSFRLFHVLLFRTQFHLMYCSDR